MKTGTLYGLFIGIGLLLLGLFINDGLKSISHSKQNLRVRGSAKRKITSNLGVLHFDLTVRAKTQKEANDAMKANLARLQGYLQETGIPASSVQILPVSIYANMEILPSGMSTSHVADYTCSQYVDVTLSEVKKVEAMMLDQGPILDKGIQMNNLTAYYYYTKLADMKKTMQSEATKDAMARGEEIAKAANFQLGGVVGAEMGILQITPPNSTEVSDYGYNDVSSLEKEITATANVTFSIKN